MMMLNLVTEGGVPYPIPGQCVAPGIPSLEKHHAAPWCLPRGRGVCLVDVTSATIEQE